MICCSAWTWQAVKGRVLRMPTCLQDNDIEREMQMNREYIDYTTEESWRWAIACESVASLPHH